MRSPIGFFNPAIPTKIFFQSRNPDGLYRPIPIPILQFCLRSFPKLRKTFLGDDFLNQYWSVEIFAHVRRKFFFTKTVLLFVLEVLEVLHE